MFITAQIFGILCLLAYVFSTQSNTRRGVLIYRSISNLFSAFQYLLLGAFAGFAVDLTGILRNLLLTRIPEKTRILGLKSGTFLSIVISLANILIGYIFFDGWTSLLIIIHSIICTIYFCRPDLTAFRVSQILSMPILIAYNILVSAYTGLAVNAIQLLFLIVGVERYDHRKIKLRLTKKKKQLAENYATYEKKKKKFLKKKHLLRSSKKTQNRL